MGAEVIKRWGTWEELLLGGAVIRHGTRDWEVVAAEVRARTVCPYTFTPEVCKAKYEALQRRFSGRKSWFEELRKQRMAELREALEQSDDSIGSLETKLKSLKAEKGYNHNVDIDSSETISLVPFQKSDGVESTSREPSRDELSVGSFTHDMRTNLSHECQIPAAVSPEESETNQSSQFFKKGKVSSIGTLVENVGGIQVGGSVRKKRGRRKRKDCSKEGSVGENEHLVLADVASVSRCQQDSTGQVGLNAGSSSAQNAGSSSINQKLDSGKDSFHDLVGLFNSIAESEGASTFHHRLDGQKRGRYKKMIRRHMDLDTIKSRIVSRLILSRKELFRDLLLITNNALVFYSKNTRGYKSASLLRELVSKTMRQQLGNYCCKTAAIVPLSFGPSMLNPPVKPRSSRPAKSMTMPRKLSNANNVVAKASNAGKRLTLANSLPSEHTVTKKKVHGRPRKAGRKSASQQPPDSQNPTTKRRKKTDTIVGKL
ncbi:putative Bromodomain 4 [Tripterygium wilfordii]|uniref:Putative Bromodomain 4 n=1 Tax=Tripterygium wilfordii TaxID=458696 RepID=A0A7J7C3Z1_TRIWF|nr:uncharacterized protein LOC119988410 [Tripterygium wilfordii]KAF5728655.1 putative Bromodomain 4 [Tripterygium wilfordii]